MTTPFCQMVGFGPGTISFLVAADRRGLLPELLERGLNILEARPTEASLALAGANYDIPSNSDASDFLFGISERGLFGRVCAGPVATLIRARGNASAPLQLAALLTAELRRAFLAALPRYPRSAVTYGRRVEALTRTRGGWKLHLADGGASESANVVLAPGSQPYVPPEIERAATAHGARLIHSETLLRPQASAALLDAGARRIAVIGASHSAFSVLHKLLESPLPGEARIELLHAGPIRRMHRSVEEARAAGEAFDPERDVCPSSGRVFRFQGLYTRSRDLFEQIRAGRHPSVTLRPWPDGHKAADMLAGFDTVIASTGYRPNLPPLRDAAGAALPAGANGSAALVDAGGHVCDPAGRPYAGLLGIGLGFGRARSAIGEPSYRGAAVGINIFQGADGDALCSSIAADLRSETGDSLEKEYS